MLAGCGMLPGTFSRVSVPSELQPEASQKLDQVVAASGVQIYRCDPRKDQPGQYEWVLQGAEALLRDPGGRYIGKHYAGPTWEAQDGSKIIGSVQVRHDPSFGRKSIPWLRLSTRSAGPPGIFSSTTTVLRVDTSGGVPSGTCNDVEQGKIVRIPYRADYNFYVTR